MKKLDKLILKSFIGPFILTFVIVVFILLTRWLMIYFDELVGKGLGFTVYIELIFYFSINMTPIAFPLAVLLSSLMTFGNLGEHSELIAIKSAGVSLIRVLVPVFFFVIFLSAIAYISNNYIVPKINLKAYSLLYDIRQKKPSLDLKEGAFYNGIPGYSIKVNKKFPDGVTLKDIIIYDHTKGLGNTDVILADSGKMLTVFNERYLMLELFNGNSYSERQKQKNKNSARNPIKPFVRNSFKESKIIFDLSSFDLERTQEELFASNRLMKTTHELAEDLDSMRKDKLNQIYFIYKTVDRYYTYHLKNTLDLPEDVKTHRLHIDSLQSKNDSSKSLPNSQKDSQSVAGPPERHAENKPAQTMMTGYDSLTISKVDSLAALKKNKSKIAKKAANQGRYVKNDLMTKAGTYERKVNEINIFDIERYKKLSQAFMCIVMFLIGAPLGAIIKKGGLGIPVLISIVFFIVSYVLTMVGEKWAKQGLVDPFWGVWAANFIMMPFGFFFLRQARIDARLFDTDFYSILIDKFLNLFRSSKKTSDPNHHTPSSKETGQI